jgi:hypothetical protein
MKKLLLILLSVGTLSAAVNWHTFDEMNAGIDSKKINKPILLMVGAATCHYCKEELTQMNASEEFTSLVNSSYYNVYVNQDVVEIPKNLNASITPTMFVLDPKTGAPMVASPAVGAVPVNQMVDYLIKIKEAYKEYLKK